MTDFTYAGITRDDPHPLKRWIQRRRLADALTFLPADLRPELIVDYGGGDGELSARLAERFASARVICFEPVARMSAEALTRLAGVDRARVETDEASLPLAAADLVLCTEVFEHLPDVESDAALAQIERVLRPGGLLALGVPVEIGPAALAKGVFRSVRRPGSQGGLRPILRAAIGRHVPRIWEEVAPGRGYHFEHIGFDHRRLERRLGRRFEIVRRRGSPLSVAPATLNAELYLLARLRPSAQAGA